MFSLRMTFYVSIDLNGCYHVQNVVGGYHGQHHVHSKDGYKKWVKEAQVDKEDIVLDKTPRACNCGLQPGMVKDHEGHITRNDLYA